MVSYIFYEDLDNLSSTLMMKTKSRHVFVMGAAPAQIPDISDQGNAHHW